MTATEKAKHTAGPWITWKAKRDTQAEFCIAVGIEVDGAHVRIASLPDMSMIGEDEANARLIAAAPELLAALETIIHDAENFDVHLGSKRAQMIRAAISKARGEA